MKQFTGEQPSDTVQHRLPHSVIHQLYRRGAADGCLQKCRHVLIRENLRSVGRFSPWQDHI